MIQDTLKAYLFQKDPFSDYLTREEFRRFREVQGETYVGVGMEISRDQQGRIRCFPYRGGAAHRAGVAVGDQLKRIDGVAVEGKSLSTVAAMARGKVGTKISLIVVTQDGEEKALSVTRSAVVTDSVVQLQMEKLSVIKIAFFARDTKEQLQNILSNRKDKATLTIDLRGNAGGDFHAAIDSAKLFLREGTTVASITNRTETKSYQSLGRAMNLTSPLYLWQDEETASAAEVFIAALTENKRAVSIGRKTFGKGTRQDIIELSDGSALIMTTGEIRTPLGNRYHGEGLKPTYALEGEQPGTSQYIRKMKQLGVP
jgi:carboxyl-terminal processing protease